MKAVFRVDASSTIGTGHVTRCMALADELRQREVDTHFLYRELPALLRKDIERAGHAAHALSVTPQFSRGPFDQQRDAHATAAMINRIGGANWLVADHYQLDETWESLLRHEVPNLLIIDDFPSRRHDCDLLLDQNFSTSSENPYCSLITPTARTLLGPKYCLLRSEFALARQKIKARDGIVRRILLCFGGSDPANHTAAAMKALLPYHAQLTQIDVALGSANPHPKEISALCANLDKVTIHSPAHDLPSLLAAADLAIGAGGTMNWERACLGVPALVFGIAGNQKKVIAELSAGGYILGVSDMPIPDISSMSAWMQAAFGNPDLLAGLSRRSLTLVDGRGAQRLANAMLPPRPLRFRPATMADREIVFRWRNDVSIRALSFESREIDWQSHCAWFQRILADPHRLLLLAEDDTQPAGVIRFDLGPEDATISVYRVPSLPAQRLGLIDQATRWLHTHHPAIRRVVAEVLPGNTDSLEAFRAAGYRETKRTLAIELEPS